MIKNRLIAIVVLFCMLHWNCQTVASSNQQQTTPLNVILLIGDGMGLAQISAASFTNGGLFLDLFKCLGLIQTSSANDYITDSAAGATAYSTGKSTYNGAIGLGADSSKQITIVEAAEQKGLSTGLIATCSITHATPAAFYAHQKNREMHQAIANDLYPQNIDFIAGSGKPYFNEQLLKAQQYQVHTGTTSPTVKVGEKLCWFYNDSINMPKAPVRGPWLKQATELALKQLSNNAKGFFLMVEGSQIDWGGHNKDFNYTNTELIDFDLAVGAALAYAKTHSNTLVIVTADHETGGLSLNAGDLKNKTLSTNYANGHHSGIMVPIYAYGPGAEQFTGTYKNTEVHAKIKALLKL